MFNLLQVLSQLSRAKDPMAMMSQMFQGNPAMQRALQMTDGKNEEEIKKIVHNLGEQAGVNVDNLINMANNMGLKL